MSASTFKFQAKHIQDGTINIRVNPQEIEYVEQKHNTLKIFFNTKQYESETVTFKPSCTNVALHEFFLFCDSIGLERWIFSSLLMVDKKAPTKHIFMCNYRYSTEKMNKFNEPYYEFQITFKKGHTIWIKVDPTMMNSLTDPSQIAGQAE